MSSRIRISAAIVTVTLLIIARPTYQRPELVSTETTSIVFNEASRVTTGTFSTEKLRVTGTGSDSIVSAGGMQMNGVLDLGTHLISNVVDPVNPQDAATKAYVDASTSGAVTGTGTAEALAKWTGAGAIGNSKLSESAAGYLDWNGTPGVSGSGFLTIGPSGTVVLGSSGGMPSSEITLNSVTGDITSNNGSLTVAGGVTADAGKRVFDVAGAGLTSSTNTVTVGAAVGGGITVNADDIQMSFCAANQIPQMNAGGTAWGCAAASAGTITGSGTVNTLPKFTSGTAIGNSSLTDDGTTVAVNGNKLTVDVSTGNTLIAGTTNLTGSLTIGASKFTVNSVSGDTTLAGGFIVNTDRFAVNATTGNSSVFGTLTADNGLRVFDVAGAGLTSSTNTVNVIALAGGGLTANADSLQMTFCAANQVPQMNAGATAWGCADPASGTIGGSATAPGVLYASGANTAATDAADFTWDATNNRLKVGTSAVTSASTRAFDVSTGLSGDVVSYIWNTNTAGYSGFGWADSSLAAKGSIGYGNSAVALTNYRTLNFISSAGPDWIFGETTGGTIIARVSMTSGSAAFSLANGSSAATGGTGFGRLIYNNTTKTFRASLDNGAYTDVITGAVTANAIPKSASSTTGALTASTITDNGTTVSTTLPLTSSGTVTGLFLSGDVAGAAPTVTSCGTTPTQPAATDTNVTGSFTTGTGGTSCTLTFAGTAANAPQCELFPANTGAVGPWASSSNTTSATWTASLVASTQYRYICLR